MTPGKLAFISIITAAFPVAVALTGAGLAKILGCDVDGTGNTKCFVLGINIGDFLSFLFLFHWFALLTIPLAMLGLIVSGIWSLFQ